MEPAHGACEAPEMSSAPESRIASPFGASLRDWRERRRMSQLALALDAGTTTRHLSFLETGRSRPSEEMVIRLSEVLDVPIRDRNRLLEGAGLPPAYPEIDLDSADLEPYRAVMERLLDAHEPYPGLVIDRYSTVVAANAASESLFGTGLVGENLVRRYYGDAGAARAIVNWTEVALAGLTRLERRLREAPLDRELRDLVELARSATAHLPRPSPPPGDSLLVCPQLPHRRHRHPDDRDGGALRGRRRGDARRTQHRAQLSTGRRCRAFLPRAGCAG
jgi:transcriptional regulator with XRE-family HTH domain